MILTILHLGTRLALSFDVRQRWRQICFAGAAMILVMTLAGTIALLRFSSAADGRRQGRLPVTATDPSSATLAISLRGEIWGGRQFPVLWIEPIGAGPWVLPPGIDTMPAPGSFVVSPGLITSGAVHGLGMDLRPYGIIGPAGLATNSEWIAYARPPEGRSLGDGGALAAVTGFGRGQEERKLRFETEDPAPSLAWASVVCAWLLLLPAVLLAASCMRAFSPARSGRQAVLHLLGLSSVHMFWVHLVEAASLAGIGSIAGALVAFPALDRLTRIPVAGISADSGQFAIPAGIQFVLLVSVPLALGVLAGVLGLRQPGDRRPDPVRAALPAPSRWRYLPLIISLGFMAASRILGESIGFALIVTSLVLGLASLPWTMPALIASLGDWFASFASPARWLAGKRLRYSAAALGRPAIALGAIVFTGGAFFGIYQRLSIHPESQGSVASAYVLAWRDLAPSDLSDFADRLPGAVVAGRAFDGDRSTLAVFSSCEDFIRAMSYSGAVSCADGLIDHAVAGDLQSAFHLTPVIGATSQESGGIGQAIVFLATPGAAESIWKATNGYLPAVNLLSIGGASAAPPLARDWLVAAGALAAIVLTLALLQSYANGALSLSSDDRRLDRLLIERGHIERVNRWILVGPSVVATLVGCLLAIAFAWAANDVELAIPATGGILILSSVCLGLNVALASLVALLQARWAAAPDRPATGEALS